MGRKSLPYPCHAITVKLPRDHARALRSEADAERSSVAALVRGLVADHLEPLTLRERTRRQTKRARS